MFRLHGSVQHYQWGDKYFIPRWIGTTVDGSPWAELWFGTHESGPTNATDANGKSQPLTQIVGELPYLVKILATSAPLSLQTHPTAAQAAEGFARESSVPQANRNYRDPNPKPELLCAITRFEALCGFREVKDLHSDWVRRGWHELASDLQHRGLTDFVEASLRREIEPPKFNLPGWAEAIVRLYPNDPALPVALCMNHVTLEPGDALFLGAGNLHAYLDGAGVEVMGSSDNVIRAGFTTKHIDIDELLRVVDLDAEPIVLRHDGTGTMLYDIQCELFEVEVVDFHEHAIVQSGDQATIVVATDVKGDSIRTGEVLLLQPGELLRVNGSGRLHVVR